MTREDDAPSYDLVERLLSRCRILVVVDHFSEMTEPTRQFIRPDDADFPVNALIITSRFDEDFVAKTTFRTRPLAGEELKSFLVAYLKECRTDLTFTEEDIRTTCEEISRVEKGQPVRIAYARIQADELLRRKKAAKALESSMVMSR